MKVITICNQKGGIGKTTTAIAMSTILNHLGHKTLLIDADVQCNSTDTYHAVTENQATLYDLVVDDDPCPVEDAIQHTEIGDIIAGDEGLAEAEHKLFRADGVFRLQEALENLSGYEYVIIDTHPDINIMLNNALVASNEIIVPITADRYAAKGLSTLSQAVSKVQKHLNPDLSVAGLLLVKFNERLNLNKDFKASYERIAEQIGTKMYRTYIRESVKAREAQANLMTLLSYAPHSTTEQDYEAFVREYLEGENNGEK